MMEVLAYGKSTVSSIYACTNPTASSVYVAIVVAVFQHVLMCCCTNGDQEKGWICLSRCYMVFTERHSLCLST